MKYTQLITTKDPSLAISLGETLTVEFKDDRKGFSDSIIYESVVAMTNTSGGRLFVGVTDAGQVVGSKRITDGTWKSTDAIAGMIMANTMPACPTFVKTEILGNCRIVVIEIPKSQTTTGTKSGKFLKRILDSNGKPQNIPMTADDIVGGVSRIGVQDFSSTVLANSDISDLDLNLVEELSARRAKQITDPHLRALLLEPAQSILTGFGLLSLHERKPNIAALLLFGRSNMLRDRLPNHEIQYQVFGPRGEILKNILFNGPIAEIFPKLLELPELLRNSNELIFRGANVVIPEYPEDSRREAFANAIVHRDYALQPGIQIQVYEKELIVTSPGPFPTGVNMNNLLSVPPTPRNRRLAEAMRSFGFVESSGRGIDFIYQGQAKFGRPSPDYSSSDLFRVSVRLSGGKANLDFCRFILTSAPDSTVFELLLLNALYFKGEMNLEQLTESIQKPATVTQEILAKLQQDRLIEMTSDKFNRFILRGTTVRSIERGTGPVRLSKIQIKNSKKALVNELKNKSPNTISALAKSIGLSPTQTRRLLIQLREEEKIQLLASKKWASKGRSK